MKLENFSNLKFREFAKFCNLVLESKLLGDEKWIVNSQLQMLPVQSGQGRGVRGRFREQVFDLHSNFLISVVWKTHHLFLAEAPNSKS